MSFLLDNYRSSLEYREILRILQRSANLDENFLWQSHSLGKNIIPVELLEIDFVSREVVVTINPQAYRLSQGMPLYFKLGYRDSVFKVISYRISQNHVIFPLPESLKTLELRAFPRHTFRPGEEKFISVRSSLKSAAFSIESGSELSVRVFDVSQQGLGLIVSETNRSFFKNNRILWVTSLQGLALEYPILAEVVYINSEVDSKFSNRKQKDLKVGLKLSGMIPQESYHIFLKRD